MNVTPVPVVVRGGVYAFDEFELDVPGFELRRSGSSVPLEPQVFEVLAFLVQNAGRALSKQELLDHVWPERYVTEAALNSRIMVARKALGDNGQEQRYIKTVHGRGYRFAGILEEETPGDGEAAAAASATALLPTTPVAFDTPATSFVGREGDLERLMGLITSDCSLLSIVGAGGLGKTRLATELAARLAAAGEPVAFAALETVDEDGLAPAIATAIGFRPTTTDVSAELLRHLAQTSLVLVLDNLEHLVDQGRQFVQDLLAAAPGVRVVVTSRVVVGLRQEWVYRVGGLALKEPGGGTPEAVRLFIERARQADASSEIPPADMELAFEVCRLVDGMPLAIELAAALTRYVGLREVLALVRNDVSALEVDLPDAPSRHQSITSLMEESLRHLGDSDRETLCALTVFEGSFSCNAARVVAGASLSLLRSLSDRSLLQSSGGRFGLHPLMRQFLRRQFAGEATLRAAHAAYYARFLSEQTEALESDGQVAATAAIDAEFPNVFAAWRWACAERRIDLVDQARYPLFVFLTFRGRFFDAYEVGRMAIAALEAAGEEGKPVLASLLTHYVWTLFRIGKPADAIAVITRARALFAETGTEPGRGIGTDPLTAVAALRLGAGQYGEAYTAAAGALRRAQARDDRIGTAFASWLAGCARFRESTLELCYDAQGEHFYRPAPEEESQGRLREADRLQEQAAMILEALGETWLRGYVEIERSHVACANSHRLSVAEHQRRAYLLRRELNDPQGMGSALVYLSETMRGLGQHDDARAMQTEARRYFQAVGDATGLAEIERGEGLLELALGNYDDAADKLLQALQTSISLAFTNNVLGVLRGLALVLAEWGDVHTALRAFRYVASHPSSTPYSRALAEAEFGQIVARTGADPEVAVPPFDTLGMAAIADVVAGAVRGAPGRSREDARHASMAAHRAGFGAVAAAPVPSSSSAHTAA